MVTTTTTIQVYSDVNTFIDFIINVTDKSKETMATEIVAKAYDDWFDSEGHPEIADIPIAEYISMCLNDSSIEHEMYYADCSENDDCYDFIQTSPYEKHYGVENEDGEPMEIIVSTPIITRFVLTDCDGRYNNKPLVYNTIEDARRDMRLKAAAYIRLGFEEQLREVIYDDGHNLVTVDGVQLADIILDHADDYIDGVDVYDNEIRIYYGNDAYKTLDRYYNNLNIFEIPV